MVKMKDKMKDKMNKRSSNKWWSDSEYDKLRDLYSLGMSVSSIADKMGRTVYSITKKISLLGLSKVSSPVISDVVPVESLKNQGLINELKNRAKEKGYSIGAKNPSVSDSGLNVKDKSKRISKLAREIARANGKRITMAMFFVEDL